LCLDTGMKECDVKNGWCGAYDETKSNRCWLTALFPVTDSKYAIVKNCNHRIRMNRLDVEAKKDERAYDGYEGWDDRYLFDQWKKEQSN